MVRLALFSLCAYCCGCEAATGDRTAARTEKPAQSVSAPIAEAPLFAPPPIAPAAAASIAVPSAVPAPGIVREKAAAGVTGKGDYEDGPISTPFKAYWTAKERVVYDIQIPAAMQLFEGLHGRKPKSHEEFMREIIDRNAVKLPELPPLSRYVYNPKLGELMVEHPRSGN